MSPPTNRSRTSDPSLACSPAGRLNVRRGVTLIFAIFALAIAAASMAAITTMLSTHARLTRQAQTDAQLRQLLLTGLDATPTATTDGDFPIQLPPSLQSLDAHLTLHRHGQTIEIEARIGTFTQRETRPTKTP